MIGCPTGNIHSLYIDHQPTAQPTTGGHSASDLPCTTQTCLATTVLGKQGAAPLLTATAASWLLSVQQTYPALTNDFSTLCTCGLQPALTDAFCAASPPVQRTQCCQVQRVLAESPHYLSAGGQAGSSSSSVKNQGCAK